MQLPTPLPELLITPTVSHVFMYSAVTWNRHRIHYDHHAAVDEGHAGVVVQRGLLGNYLARLVTKWVGARGELRTLSWKVLASARPGQRLVGRGAVVGAVDVAGERRASCELELVNEAGTVVARGNATVMLEGL